MRAIRLLAASALLLGSLVYATPVAAGDPCYHGFDLPTRTEGSDSQVKMMPCAFAPTVIRVAPGTTVEWFSGPDFVHLLTGANQEWGSRDKEIVPGSTVAYRFDRPGVYPYACALHRGMSGTVIVGNGVAAAGTGPAVVAVKEPTGSSASAVDGAAVEPAPAKQPAAAPSIAAGPATPAAATGTEPRPAATRSDAAPAVVAVVTLAAVVLIAAGIAVERRARRLGVVGRS